MDEKRDERAGGRELLTLGVVVLIGIASYIAWSTYKERQEAERRAFVEQQHHEAEMKKLGELEWAEMERQDREWREKKHPNSLLGPLLPR